MARVLFILALLVVAASAFVAPANHAVTSPAFTRSSTPVNMIPMEVMDTVAQSTNMIASASNDFGGYSYPVIGLALLATLILYLSPPLADE